MRMSIGGVERLSGLCMCMSGDLSDNKWGGGCTLDSWKRERWTNEIGVDGVERPGAE